MKTRFAFVILGLYVGVFGWVGYRKLSHSEGDRAPATLSEPGVARDHLPRPAEVDFLKSWPKY